MYTYGKETTGLEAAELSVLISMVTNSIHIRDRVAQTFGHPDNQLEHKIPNLM